MDTVINCQYPSENPPLIAYFFCFVFNFHGRLKDRWTGCMSMVIQRFRSLSDCVQTLENKSKQQLSLSKWKDWNSSRLSARRVNVYVCETMPDAHALCATAAAHPQVGTSRDGGDHLIRLQLLTLSGSVRICCPSAVVLSYETFSNEPLWLVSELRVGKVQPTPNPVGTRRGGTFWT